MYSVENIEDSENSEELDSLQYQVEEVRLQGKLGKQNFQEKMKKVFEPVADKRKNTSENTT